MLTKREPGSGDQSTQAQSHTPSLLTAGIAFSAVLLFGELSSFEYTEAVRGSSAHEQREDPLGQLRQPRAFARQQSPRVLDLTTCEKKDVPDITILENGTAQQIVRSDHGLKVAMNPGSAVRADRKIYHLKQLHFHTGQQANAGSEHAVIRKPGEKPHRYPAEIHFVHKTDSGDTGVIAVFVTVGKENADLAFILDSAPTDPQNCSYCSKRFTPLNLIPEKRVPIHYEGSLTTPPYNGPIKWMVLVDPIEASAQQLKQLREMIGNNARGVQEGKTPVTLDTQVL